MSVDLIVPTLGESILEASILKWIKHEGDEVAADEEIVELETDKATITVSAPSAGYIKQILFEEGDTVSPDTKIAIISSQPVTKTTSAKNNTEQINQTTQDIKIQNTVNENNKLSPAVNRIIQENNIDPTSISGSGKRGAIRKADLINTSAQSVSSPNNNTTPNTNYKQREEVVKMSRVRASIAKRLKQSQNTAAILSTFNEIDMTEVMAIRKQYKELFSQKYDANLGFISLFIKACVIALQELPAVNAEIRDDNIIFKNYYNISVAMATPNGLVVPVITDCDTKSVAEIEKDIAYLANKAKSGNIAIQDLQGGTFTISNGGTYGSLLSTPIINPPQSAILGMHTIQMRPVVNKITKVIEARPMMYVALSYDHRIIDGKEAITFLVKIKNLLENPVRMLINI